MVTGQNCTTNTEGQCCTSESFGRRDIFTRVKKKLKGKLTKKKHRLRVRGNSDSKN